MTKVETPREILASRIARSDDTHEIDRLGQLLSASVGDIQARKEIAEAIGRKLETDTTTHTKTLEVK